MIRLEKQILEMVDNRLDGIGNQFE